MLNAYVSVCPLPEVAGGLPWVKRKTGKALNTLSEKIGAAHTRARVKAQRKPISRTAQKGSVQPGDELVATLGDQALGAP